MGASVTYLFLFGSGLSALVYQLVWMREFRLVFGASTASTAAVSALFMAGLGVGGWLLGPRADRHDRPLLLYARLELAIALLAALSPFLLYVTRSIYLKTGGMLVLGFWGATASRLALAAVVIGVPAFLMGGTLPAAVRAVTLESDGVRKGLGRLYGVNTLGALIGTLAANFVLLEHFGAKRTLYIAVAVNLLVCVGALRVGKTRHVDPIPPSAEPDGGSGGAAASATGEADGSGLPHWFALVIAGGVGFVFFLMELVWYRMLAPVLGGSNYTFGLILAVALGGIALGGLAYPWLSGRIRPSAWLLAATCLLEALAIMIPYAVGDWIPATMAQLRPLGAMGFHSLVAAWAVVTLSVVFLSAFVSGIQFPLLIALLGKGGKNIGRQTGRAYACNTVGAIVGSLAGGFGLIPLLGADGCWVLSGAVLTVFGLVLAGYAWRESADSPSVAPEARRQAILGTALVLLLLGVCFASTGPTAAWRHSPVGAGRVAASATTNQIRSWMADIRRKIIWEKDGIESAVAIHGGNGYSFFINGKSDGNVLEDRGTQIMCGLLGAALHGEAKRAMVVGLGTGCTAGWLSAVEGMEWVDVVELEPAVIHMARLCAAANHDVVGKAERGDGVRIIVNDAREVLTTVPERYDVIVSEPSNPYRAGIASLFTREFYREVGNKLNPGGIFVNWCQAYEVDSETVLMIVATLRSAFNHVECWATQGGDLVFVSSEKPIRPDPALLAGRLERETFSDAMRIAWRSNGLEGFLAHFIATDGFLAEISKGSEINVDDFMQVEYGFARSVGRSSDFSVAGLLGFSTQFGANLPDWAPADLDVVKTNIHRVMASLTNAGSILPAQELRRFEILQLWDRRIIDPAALLAGNTRPSRLDFLAAAEGLAERGDAKALELVPEFESWWPACAAMVRSRLLLRQERYAAAAAELESAVLMLRESPWEVDFVINRGLLLMYGLAARKTEFLPGFSSLLEEPFSLAFIEQTRKNCLLLLAAEQGDEKVADTLRRFFEPHVPWVGAFLAARFKAYSAIGHPLAARAAADLQLFLDGANRSLASFIAERKEGGVESDLREALSGGENGESTAR